MRPAHLFLLFLLTGVHSLYSQPPAVDPHEDPRVNGSKHTGDTKPPPRDPHAVPDPIPVRPADPDTSRPDTPAAGTKPANDSDIMRKIRASLRKDPATRESLTGVKVIAHAGSVTLQGTVRSAEIRHSIEQKATAVAGPGKVTDEIDVKGAPPRNPPR
ncbi:MAG TPA: BON domain-containing protein [Bryobacteraceae bacterium]|jgi:hypothetical protein